ncbi:CLUMA_CG014790, isoform A [Clunio marinus]|uniref:CLUMA_CG014790, isoform A n=1 Tax=Clunio marinus TaxID=568069 RepID=A0A1J1IQZ1_9DIPT|nr:CLUMA_CG014790, isoform A [Clunio marinus]
MWDVVLEKKSEINLDFYSHLQRLPYEIQESVTNSNYNLEVRHKSFISCQSGHDLTFMRNKFIAKASNKAAPFYPF